VAVEDQRAGGQAEVVGVGGVEQCRRAATAFVAEEVAVRGKRHFVVEFLDARLDHVDQQLLGRDQRDLQVAVRVALGEQHLRRCSAAAKPAAWRCRR
jgi:hypothetical protein